MNASTDIATAAAPGTAGTARDPHPILVGGEWVGDGEPLTIANPADPSTPAGVTYAATEEQYERAVRAAVEAAPVLASLAAYERGGLLRGIAEGIAERGEEIARVLALESGKPVRDARTEVARGALTFRLGAEEAERRYGEVIPLDLNAASRDRVAITSRFPVGPVAGIVPFNLPLGLAAHKVAPALAAGCPIVLKPASSTPLTMLTVAEVIQAAGAPRGSVSVMPMSVAVGDRMVTDPRFGLLTFTGSPAVGWDMKARAGHKKVVLELGGNAAVVVDADADVERAAQRCVYGAFKYAGQLCVSVQRMFVHERVWDEFMERFVAGARALRVGDPLDDDTDLGPMLDPGAARRAHGWVQDALAAGATALTGGTPEGAYMPPTVLVDVPSDADVYRKEAFAPLAVAAPFRDFDEALEAVNDSAFGLQAGIFTNDFRHAWQAYRRLEVGGVVIGDTPAYRIDHMPYGGVKDSGLGREGLRWAIEEMTELRTMIVAQQSS